MADVRDFFIIYSLENVQISSRYCYDCSPTTENGLFLQAVEQQLETQ